MGPDLKADIEAQIEARYRYTLPDDWQSALKPLQVLREISLKQGLQLCAREYVFSKDKAFRGDESPATTSSGDQMTNGVHAESKRRKKKSGDSPITNGSCPVAHTTFTPEDIVNIAPIVKDAAPRSALAEEALEAGRISLAQSQKQLGQELVLESLSLHEQIYGILHPEVDHRL